MISLLSGCVEKDRCKAEFEQRRIRVELINGSVKDIVVSVRKNAVLSVETHRGSYTLRYETPEFGCVGAVLAGVVYFEEISE